MATLDFTPLYHSTVGFDRLPDLLAHALTRDESGYPPYNIEKTGDDAYRIVMALAGFSRDDIEIVSERNRLSIRGALKGKNENTFLHQGIAQRSFQKGAGSRRLHSRDRCFDERRLAGHRPQAGTSRSA